MQLHAHSVSMQKILTDLVETHGCVDVYKAVHKIYSGLELVLLRAHFVTTNIFRRKLGADCNPGQL